MVLWIGEKDKSSRKEKAEWKNILEGLKVSISINERDSHRRDGSQPQGFDQDRSRCTRGFLLEDLWAPMAETETDPVQRSLFSIKLFSLPSPPDSTVSGYAACVQLAL